MTGSPPKCGKNLELRSNWEGGLRVLTADLLAST